MYMEGTWSSETYGEFHIIPHPSGTKTPKDRSVLTRRVDHHTVIGGLVVAMAVYACCDMRGAFLFNPFSVQNILWFSVR